MTGLHLDGEQPYAELAAKNAKSARLLFLPGKSPGPESLSSLRETTSATQKPHLP